MGRGSCEKRVSAMKKILFILLAIGFPVGVATLANPGDLRIGGWPQRAHQRTEQTGRESCAGATEKTRSSLSNLPRFVIC